jgi:DNA-binding SARP family transcriptional activator
MSAGAPDSPLSALPAERAAGDRPNEDRVRRLAAGLSWLGHAVPARMFESALRLLQRPGAVPAWASEIEVGAGVAAPAADAAPEPAAPSLEVYLLSPFSVFANDRAITDWPNCKGRSIFKYLATHRAQPVPREVLMEVFWPHAEPDAARNNLNVAIYGLRRALARAEPEFPFVLFRQGCYGFNPKLRLWIDAEAFADCAQRGHVAELQGDWDAAMAAYCLAQAVYRSALLVDDRYEDWLLPLRQGLQERHVAVLQRLAARHEAQHDHAACAAVAARLLEVDSCDEAAHRLLMQCYSRMGHAHLALRQYHLCVEAMARELNLIPSPQTVALAQQIRRRQLN